MTLEQELEIITIAREVNGDGCREREKTGNLPTVMLYGYGHVAELEVNVHESGWSVGENACRVFTFKTDEPLDIEYFEEYRSYMKELIKKNDPALPTKAEQSQNQ